MIKWLILILIPSPQARFTPSPASVTHLMVPLVSLPETVQKTIRTWRPRQFTEKIDFEMVVSWLIDWVYLKCDGTDKLIAWLVLSIKTIASYGLIGWLNDFEPSVRSIDWLIYSTRFRGDTGFVLVIDNYPKIKPIIRKTATLLSEIWSMQLFFCNLNWLQGIEWDQKIYESQS